MVQASNSCGCSRYLEVGGPVWGLEAHTRTNKHTTVTEDSNGNSGQGKVRASLVMLRGENRQPDLSLSAVRPPAFGSSAEHAARWEAECVRGLSSPGTDVPRRGWCVPVFSCSLPSRFRDPATGRSPVTYFEVVISWLLLEKRAWDL